MCGEIEICCVAALVDTRQSCCSSPF